MSKKTKTPGKVKAPYKAKTTAKGKTGWLVMLYLAGDNNLTESMVLALQTLKALKVGGQFKDGAIVAQLDPSGAGLPTQTYDFTHSTSGDTTRFPHLDDCLDASYSPNESNTGNPNALSGFIEWAHNKYPEAIHHLLILSGHGSGTTEDFLLKDDNAMDSLSIDELGLALSSAHQILKKKIDILGMDTCFMSMGEVCFQIREHVDIVVGAEGMEPQFGWPYSRILDAAEKLTQQNPAGKPLEPERLATTIVDQYVEFYSDYDRSAGRSVDLAAVDLRKLGPLRPRFRELIRALDRYKDADTFNRLVVAHWRAQTYKADQFVDLKDLCEQTKKEFSRVPGATKISQACDGVIETLKSCVLKSGCSGFAYQHSYGLSVYFPWSAVSPAYKTLKFARTSGWGAFLDKFVRETRRESRFDEGRRTHDPRVVDAITTVLTQAHMEPLERAKEPRTKIRTLRTSVKRAFEEQLGRQLLRVPRQDSPFEDLTTNLSNSVGSTGFGPHNSRYTGEGSRYTGEGSRYTGEGSRSQADRERAVKNLAPVIGKAFWPPDKPRWS